MKTRGKIATPKQSRTRKRSTHKATVTVVIPVLNESRTISNVVKFALLDGRVAEVLVVDDGSIDGTPERAERAGARVVTSSLLGKGASMEDGLQAAHTEFLLYLDGDLRGLRHDLIHRMTRPLMGGTADFVKARFARRALGIPAEQVLAVGDSDNDVCLLRAAGISVAFQPKTPAVRDAARHVVRYDLRGVLRLLGEPVSKQPEIRHLATAAPMQADGEYVT